jgi:hypothetical protein
MFFRRLAAPLFALFAGAVILYPRMARTSDPTDVPPVKHSSSANDVTRDKLGPTESKPSVTDFPTARDLVSQFLFRDNVTPAPASNPAGGPGYSIEFLIAMVPDPIESRLPRFFDSFIESLQRGAEAAGYTIDRVALPWPASGREAQDAGPVRHRRPYDSQPGLMLFRDPSGHKLLLVFLVGENPTAGIRKNALFSALEQLAQFYPQGPKHAQLPQGFPLPDASAPAQTIRIMGPSFSGSAVSLRFVLDRWNQEESPNWKFEIISGTATAIKPEMLSASANDGVSFQAAVPPDTETLQAVSCYIAGLGYRRMALLTESNTAYGESATHQSASENKGAGGSASSPCADGRSLPEVLTLPFPIHISRLREAAGKATAAKGQAAPGSASGSTAAPPQAEGSTDEPGEVAPAYSDLDVQSTELTLANLLSTIAREQYSYVGIIATDVRDVIFLAQEVRKHSPATILFTLNSDLLYAYPDVNSATHGMIVFTPYPLFNLEQLWTYAYGGGRPRLQFSNQAAEGVYNATLALLHRDEDLVDYGPPLRPSTNAPSTERLQPSLWVTAIGSGETLPVSLLGWKDDDHYTYSPVLPAKAKKPLARPTVGRGIYSENAVVAVIVLSLLLCAYSALMICEYRHPTKNGPSRLLAFLADSVSPAYWSECRLFLICSCVSLLAFYVVAVTAFGLPFIAGRELGTGIPPSATPRVALCVATVTLVLLVWATHTLVSAFRAAPAGQHGSAPEVIIATFLGCAIVFALALLLVISWIGEVRRFVASGFFNHLRSFDFAGGLSPLVPFFLVAAAACLWALCSFRRLKVLDILRATGTLEKPQAWLSFLSLDVPSFSGVRELENNIKHTLESSTVISFQAYAVLMFVAFNAWTYFFYHRLVRALEVRPFYWLFGVAFFIVYWALLMEFLRLIFTWRSLILLLRRLSWHPLLAAVKRYRDHRPNLARMNLTRPPSDFAVLESSLSQAGRVVQAARELISDPAAGRLGEMIRQSLPLWEAQLQTAGTNLGEALQMEWTDDSRAESASSMEAGRKKRAPRLRNDWRQSLRARCHAHRALFQLLQSLGKPMDARWSSTYREADPGLSAPGAKRFFEEAEEFIVTRVVSFLSVVFPSLRNLAMFVLAGLLLMLLAVTFYPFQPRNEFLFFNWVVILSFVATVFLIFIQMDRDTVLSLLNDRQPGQFSLSPEMVLRLALYLAVPLLALFGAQFPDSVRQILSVFTTTQAGP